VLELAVLLVVWADLLARASLTGGAPGEVVLPVECDSQLKPSLGAQQGPTALLKQQQQYPKTGRRGGSYIVAACNSNWRNLTRIFRLKMGWISKPKRYVTGLEARPVTLAAQLQAHPERSSECHTAATTTLTIVRDDDLIEDDNSSVTSGEAV
jgi:hypothetical protein